MEGGSRGPVSPSGFQAPPKIKVNPRLSGVKAQEKEYAVSPNTPLLSTAIEENAWVCGRNSQGQLGVGPSVETVTEPQVLQVVRRWAALSIGGAHSAGVAGDGECYTWGLNDQGQLGVAAGAPKTVPTKMDILRGWDVRAIACGDQHTVAITPEDVISWGANNLGQCGQGERSETTWVKPRSLKPLQSLYVSQVVCGRTHTLCVTATSQVFAWGGNNCGQLGLGDTTNRRAPTIVEGLWAMPVLQLAAGDQHSAALTASGFLFTWGCNDQGQLGLPAVAEHMVQVQATRTASERRRVKRQVNQRFLTAMLDMGINLERAELALCETGNVGVEVATEWLFSVPEHVLEKHLGSDPSTPTAEADTSDEVKRSHAPRRSTLNGVRTVAAGGAHTVAVTDTAVYSWGSNKCGQLGTRTFQDKNKPTEITDLAGKHVTQVACGSAHTVFLCRDGLVYGCGSTEHGELPYLRFSGGAGDSDCDDDSLPRSEICVPTRLRLPFLQAARGGRAPVVSAVVAGGFSSAFLTRAPDEFPQAPQPHLWEKLQNALSLAAEESTSAKGGPSSRHLKPIVHAVEMVFASAAALSAAFGRKDEVGIDVKLLDDMQTRMLSLYSTPPPDVNNENAQMRESIASFCAAQVQGGLAKATSHLLEDLHRNVRLLSTPERAQVVLAAAQSPLLGDKSQAAQLIPRLCSVILNAPSHCRHTLVKWWAEYPPELLEARVVKPLQQYLTDELVVTKKLTVSVMNTIKVLAKVEEANQLGRLLPPDAFYNQLISEKLDVEDHYVAWSQTHDQPQHNYGADGPFSFCSYPFLLNPRAKSKLLHTEARYIMQQTVHQAKMEAQPGRGQQQAASAIGQDAPVLPNNKAARDSTAPSTSASAASVPERNVRRTRSQSQAGGLRLRAMWNQMWRNSSGEGDDPTTTPVSEANYQADERQMVARQMSGTRPWAGNEAAQPSTASESTAVEMDIDPPAGAEEGAEASSSAPSAAGAAPSSASRSKTASIERLPKELRRSGSMNLPKPEDSGVPAVHAEMCILRIRRNHLVEDALNEIARQRARDLLKPLRVHFIGEDGIDAGGVKKEFFQLLVTELLCPDYGMLIFQPESRTYWFNPATLEPEDEFMLIGLVLGLAIYNAVILDFPLPLALYKKLLGQQVTLRDLQDMDPTLGKSLQQLLAYEGEGSVADVFCQSFTAGLPGFGEMMSLPLCENGDDITVTEDNRRDYVELYINFVLNTSIHKQFEAFAKGFMMLCGGPAIHLFSATEIERLVCGNPILDFLALQNNARYDGGFTADHRAVKWLWDIVGEFDEDERRHFLKFFTGSDRAPIGGLGNLRCIIQRDGMDSNKLPTSHTCFNTLLLPSYRSRAHMAARLRLAIMNSEGFGLE